MKVEIKSLRKKVDVKVNCVVNKCETDLKVQNLGSIGFPPLDFESQIKRLILHRKCFY